MTRRDQIVRPQPRLRLSALLVFGLLTGLLGMHAMGPAGAQMPDHRMSASTEHGDVVAVSMQNGCQSDGNGCDQHSQHADSTCASGSVAGAPALPAPAPAPACLTDEPEAVLTSAQSATGGGRAPPSLAELQLLRI